MRSCRVSQAVAAHYCTHVHGKLKNLNASAGYCQRSQQTRPKAACAVQILRDSLLQDGTDKGIAVVNEQKLSQGLLLTLKGADMSSQHDITAYS